VQPRFHDYMAVVYLTVASTQRVNYISSSSQPLGLGNNFMSLPELLFWTDCWSITCDGQTCTPRFAWDESCCWRRRSRRCSPCWQDLSWGTRRCHSDSHPSNTIVIPESRYQQPSLFNWWRHTPSMRIDFQADNFDWNDFPLAFLCMCSSLIVFF
jgi:hypothetical protein